MVSWIKPRDHLPPEKVLVMARNPYVEAISWIDVDILTSLKEGDSQIQHTLVSAARGSLSRLKPTV